MLPTTGFFKDIDCPYYEKSCVRPYCHFRHRKRSQEPPSPTEVPTYKPTPKSELASTKSHIPISYVPDLVRSSRILNLSDRPTYKPTPISFLSAQNVSQVCEYKPVSLHLDGGSKKEIDLADLSSEFDLIDEILEDGDLKDSSKQHLKNKQEKNKSKDSDNNKRKDDEDRKNKYSKSRSEIDVKKEVKDKDKEREKNRNRDKEKLHGGSDYEKDKEKFDRSKSKRDHESSEREDEKSNKYNNKGHSAKLKIKGNNRDCENSDSEIEKCDYKREVNSHVNNKYKNKNKDYDSGSCEEEKRGNRQRDRDNEKQKIKNKNRGSESSECEQESGEKYKSKKSRCADEGKEEKKNDKNKGSDREKQKSYKNKSNNNEKHKNRDEINKNKNREPDEGNSDHENKEKHKTKNREHNNESSDNKKNTCKNKSKNYEQETNDKHKSRRDCINRDDDSNKNKVKNREREEESSERETKKSDKYKSRNYERDDDSNKNKHKKREREEESSEWETNKSDKHKSRNHERDDKSSDCDSKKSKDRNRDRDKNKSKDYKNKRDRESSDTITNKRDRTSSDTISNKRDLESSDTISNKRDRDGSDTIKRDRDFSDTITNKRDRDSSDNKRESKEKRNGDKNKDRHENKDKHKQDRDRHKYHGKKATNKGESEQHNLIGTEQHNLRESEHLNLEMDFDNEINFDLYEEDDEMEMDSIEAECYKIFNEYTPPVIEEKYEPVSIKSPETEPVPYNPTCKKRIAYDKATESVSKITYNKPKAISNASLAMLNRLKLARQAQAGNDYKDLLTELNQQKEHLKRKAMETTHFQNKRFASDDDVMFEYSPLSSKEHNDLPKPNLSSSSRVSHLSSSKSNPSSSSKYNHTSSKHSHITSTTHPTSSHSKHNSKPSSNNKFGINSSSTPNISSLSKNSKSNINSVSLVDDIISGRSGTVKMKRIAPVQNVGLIQRAKAQFDEMVKNKAAQVLKTQAQTMSRGNKRVAHIPDASLSDIPDVLKAERSKLPVNVRTRYLTMLADECVKLYVFKEDAYQRALNEELKCYEKCSVLGTYRNSAMLAINRLRKEIQERENTGLGPIQPGEVSSGDSNSSVQGKRLYEAMECYILTEDELVLHGYPREGPNPGRAIITSESRLVADNLEDNQRVCCRCHKVYLVDDDGMPLESEDCVYHPLRKRTLRGERTYLCCKSTDDTGCAMSNTHVSESNPDRVLEGYQSTMGPESQSDPRSCAVYALDCEMCYTTIGLELTRVTIVDTNLKTVYESLVKPLNPIIDYNTRFSGITEDQMERTSTSILQVQANILHLCNSKTILIGHSLESDMKALKIIHSNIIDTSVMFPHKFGLPHKRALRVLASEYLRKIIQNGTDGHDSAEDALACMELVLWKVKEDMKTKGMKG